MTRPPFTPADGIARWRRALAAIIELSPGEIITHEELAAAVGDTYRPGCKPIVRAMRELRDSHGRSMIPVVGVGYRVLHPVEHLEVSTRHMRSGERKLVRAHSEIASANRAGLSSDETRLANDLQIALAAHVAAVRRDRKLFR